MKRILTFCLVGQLLNPCPAQTLVNYEYWFDTNDASTTTVSVAGSHVTIPDLVVDADALSIGTHWLHFRFKDILGRWSSVVSRPFHIGPVTPYEIVAVRYWTSNAPVPSDMHYKFFDPPAQYLTYDSLVLDACSLHTGSNMYIKLQLLDNHGQWSSVVTQAPLMVSTPAAFQQPADIVAGAPFCTGDQVWLSVTPPTSGATPTGYDWIVPSDWASVPSTGDSILVTVGTGSVAIQVRGTNACTNGPYRVETFEPVPIPDQPVAGPAWELGQCAGGLNVSYGVTQVAGVTYDWSISGGWTDSVTGASITTDIGPADASISVTPYNACNDSGPSLTATITVDTPPEQPSIVGDLAFCEADSVLLSVTAVPGEDYAWTGTTPDTGYTVWASQAGMVTVTATTEPTCGQEMDAVLVNEIVLQLQAIEHIDGGVGDTVTFIANPDLLDTVDYMWSFPPGLTWSGTDTDHTDSAAVLVIEQADISLVMLCVHAEWSACAGDSICADGTTTANVHWAELTPAIRVQPNPSPGRFELVLTGAWASAVEFAVIDESGRQVYRPSTFGANGSFVLNLSNQAPGVYLLRCIGAHESKVLPLIIQR